MLERLGRTAARHRLRFVLVWIVLTIGVAVLAVAVGGTTNDDIVVPGAQSQQALDILEERFPSQAGGSATIVFHARGGGVTDGANGTAIDESLAAIDESLAAVEKLPHVQSVSGPEGALGAAFTSSNGRIAFAQVQYDEPTTDLPEDVLDDLERATAPARAEGLQVEFGGDVIDYVNRARVGPSDLIGLAVAVVILLLAFGSVIAMGLPIATALVALGCGLSGILILAGFTNVGTLSPTVGAMIGLGVGIDYSLFIITRHRENLAAGLDVETSIARALATAGQAVLFAGTTVIVALLGLRIADIPYITVLAVTTALVVAVTVVAALTLLPALIALAGRNIDKWRVHLRRDRSEVHAPNGGAWARWARTVTRHPWVFGALSLVVLLVLLAPVPSLRLGVTDDGDDPKSETQRQAFDLLQRGFGPGINGPLLVVVELPRAGDDAALSSLESALTATSDVDQVVPPELNEAKDVAVIVVVPDSSPDAEATSDLVADLREKVIPDALRGSRARASVGGVTAEFIDISDRMSERLPYFIVAVVVAAFLLLLVAFRSVVIALTAAMMNLLSVGAAYGVVVAVFQWGWGKSVIGLEATVPISPFVPMMMFAALFGLSMDYQVFLLSRIRERWLATGDNSTAVVDGLTSTARVIGSAALIMISVFLSFVPNPNPVVKMFGIGLAAAVFVDATLVRLMLVPSIMQVLGRANWWLPRWLDRVLPHIALEGTAAPPTTEGAGVTARSG